MHLVTTDYVPHQSTPASAVSPIYGMQEKTGQVSSVKYQANSNIVPFHSLRLPWDAVLGAGRRRVTAATGRRRVLLFHEVDYSSFSPNHS